MDFADIFADPAWFPDRIDPGNRLVRLVRTSHHILASSAFLDGRTPLSIAGADPLIVGLDAFIEHAPPAPPMRWIFHESFCGSTLLARMLTIGGRSLCLREPQILVDLAMWRTTLGEADRTIYQAGVSATLAHLSRRWNPGEVIAIKPTNWINPEIAEFWAPTRGDRAAFVQIPAEDFLIAVLRGGRDRIAYTLRFYERAAESWPAIARIVEATMPAADDVMVRAAYLVVAAHWAQRCLLEAARAGSEPGKAIRIDFPDFLTRDAQVAAVVACLGLDVSTEQRAFSIAVHLPHHAKQPDRPSPSASESRANDTIRTLHAAAIEAAAAFAKRIEQERGTTVVALGAAGVG